MAKHSDQKKKHTPKRASNKNREAQRQRSWARGQRRKAARREAQAKREARNKVLRANGELTPWLLSKAARAANRHPA